MEYKGQKYYERFQELIADDSMSRSQALDKVADEAELKVATIKAGIKKYADNTDGVEWETGPVGRPPADANGSSDGRNRKSRPKTAKGHLGEAIRALESALASVREEEVKAKAEMDRADERLKAAEKAHAKAVRENEGRVSEIEQQLEALRKL